MEKKEPLLLDSDIRDNIYYYDEEGGGEDDQVRRQNIGGMGDMGIVGLAFSQL